MSARDPRAPRAPRALSALCVLSALSACGPTGLYRTADPVPRGRWQLGAALGTGFLRDTEQQTRFPTGHVELEGRRGMAASLDLGLKLYTVGAEANATWRLLHQRWSLALAPAFGGARTRENGVITDATHLHGGSAFIASRPVSRRWTFAAGPLAGWGLYWPAGGGSAQGVWAGGFALFDFRTSGGFHLIPELSLFDVVWGEVPVRGFGARIGLGLRWDL
jgi:hypothetical protein